ncbi:MAG: hypothetical protein U9Q22_06365 [Candidatus Altiarchaeota archaeon]|nr:hypothetical protein [Candidatus Altiarchaeota archaeon]
MDSKKVVGYSSDPLDLEFRRNVIELFDSAEGEVVIITGEAQAFGYQDVRWAVKRARDRGVKFRVYATSPLYVDKWLAYGCDVYRGVKEVGDHYLLVDGKSFIHSYPHVRKRIGVREGEIHLGDSEGSREILDRFKDLVAGAERVTSGVDPFERVLGEPSDYGVSTDSSRIDEAIYA